MSSEGHESVTGHGAPFESRVRALPGLPQAAAGQTVLCVSEDAGSTQRDVLPALHAAGYRIEVVVLNGDEPDIALQKPYALMLIDVQHRVDTAFRLCAAARPLTSLPIVLVLRDVARRNVLRGFEAGADACLLAPFDGRELLARVGSLVRRHLASPPLA